MLRKLSGAVAISILLTGTALAQLPMPGISLGGGERKLSPEEQAKKDATDKAYNSTMSKIPEKKLNDPWGNIRNASPTASATTKPQ
jgi:hypothetical protein